jgi:hypothetical protein
MIDDLFGDCLANTARSMALDVAVAAPTIQAHGIVQEGNQSTRSGTIEGQEIGVALPTLLLKERVKMGMPK